MFARGEYGSMNLQGRLGKYSISDPEKPIASGRQAILFLGTDRHSNPVCLKLFQDDDEMPEEMQREMDAMKKLQHPAILPILDYATTRRGRNPPFLVLPFCEGGNLRDLMKEKQFVPTKDALRILSSIAGALDYAHENGIVHGDIKPENILFRDTGRQLIMVSDFGMSRHTGLKVLLTGSTAVRTDKKATAPGGTLAYMSPEQYDTGRISARSDIFSLTVIAYEMLAGTFPYDVERPIYHFIRQRIDGEFRKPQESNPNLRGNVAAALEDGLSPDPMSRPATAMELVDRLSQKQTHEQEPLQQQSPPAMFIGSMHVGDSYSAGQAGAMGPAANASDMSFHQAWSAQLEGSNLAALARGLSLLRRAMREIATEPQHDMATAEIALAETAASQGDGPKVLEYLQKAGHWALAVSSNAEKSAGRRIRIRGSGSSAKGFSWESESVLQVGRAMTQPAGAMEPSQMTLEDRHVSREHAEIRFTPDGWHVKDLQSTNGTFINGSRLEPGTWPLKHGDILQFGGLSHDRFVVELQDAEVSLATAALKTALSV
jgi:serine/threonine protein kinase